MLTSASLEESKRINDICHSHSPPISFVRVETRGVFASVFCDFGADFMVQDVDGELWGAATSNSSNSSSRCRCHKPQVAAVISHWS